VPISEPKAKPKLQLKKKKKVDDDPFASDEEEVKPKAKASKPPSKMGGLAKKPPPKVSTGTKRVRDESESEGEVNPKTKVLRFKE